MITPPKLNGAVNDWLPVKRSHSHSRNTSATALKLPFVNSPLIAALFRPLARLPFSRALFIFLIISPLMSPATLAPSMVRSSLNMSPRKPSRPRNMV